jgi:hypothetical protein|tara:strand:+ start:276 stop:788 length:513 start_codon:yes stop_codon:yes gene_type:complete
MQEKKKAGRKRITFTEEQLEQIEKLSGLGVSERSIAEVLGVSLSTLARRKRDSAIFDTTLKRGKIKAVAEVSNALFDSATGRNGNPPNVSAQIFFLKNRGEKVADWSDVQKIENTFSLDEIINSAKKRIPNATAELKRVEDVDSNRGRSFLDSKESLNVSGSLPSTKTET